MILIMILILIMIFLLTKKAIQDANDYMLSRYGQAYVDEHNNRGRSYCDGIENIITMQCMIIQ